MCRKISLLLISIGFFFYIRLIFVDLEKIPFSYLTKYLFNSIHFHIGIYTCFNYFLYIHLDNFSTFDSLIKMVLGLLSVDNWKSHWFIDACHTKNTEKVRQLLPVMDYEEINATDDDGNTGLHIACMQDNYDLVFLLLHSDLGKTLCSRTISNKQNMYAYEYVASEKVRSLFIPSEFANNAIVEINQYSGSVQIRRICQTTSDEQELPIPNGWLNGHTNPQNTVNAQAFLAFSRLSWFARKKFRFRKERQVCEVVRTIIRRCTDDDQRYDELMRFFNLFIQTRRAEHLLTLFTMSADFCHILRKENRAFTTLLYLYLKTCAHRGFGPGTTYRGMTTSDPVQYRKMINDYRWTMQNDEYLLETCVFQSTSKDISIAHFFYLCF